MNTPPQAGLAVAGAVAAAAPADLDLVICPPAILLPGLRQAFPSLALGGQDCHMAASGAFTGDISAAMLRQAGCAYVIAGHSERRSGHCETNDMVRRKAARAHENGLCAIICIGETAAEHASRQTETVLAAQLGESLPESVTAANCVIAYEPVWAIGTGNSATVAQVRHIHRYLRQRLAESHGPQTASGMRLIYGGSLTPENAASLMAEPDVDGGLVGSASLNAKDFLAIAAAFPGGR